MRARDYEMNAKIASAAFLIVLFLLKLSTCWSLSLDLAVTYEIDGYSAGSLFVYEGRLYVGTSLYDGKGRIIVFDGIAWTLDFEVEENQIWDFAEFDGRLYACSGYRYVPESEPHVVPGGVIYVYDPSVDDWGVAWDSPADQALSFGVYNERLYVGTSGDGLIYVYDGVAWNIAYDVDPQHHITSFSEYQGKLYVGTESGETGVVGAIYVYDGVVWRKAWSLPSVRGVPCLAVYDGKLYAGTYPNGTLYVFDGTDWNIAVDTNGDFVWCMTICSDMLFAGTWDDGLIYVFNRTGWQMIYEMEERKVGSLTEYENRLYVASLDKIYASQVFLKTDLNKDRTVNILDISIVAMAFGSEEGDENYDVLADLDENGEVNILDISIVAMDYGKTV